MTAGSDRWVSDAQREAAATALGMHLAAGRLSMEEFRARLEAVYAATTASELAQVTADLPVGGAGVPGMGTGPVAGGDIGSLASRGRRVVGRILGTVALLLATGVAGVILLLAALAGHGSLLVPGLVLLLAPVALVALTAGALVWAGRRAWRSGAWMEAVPAAAGMPGAGRAARAVRLMLVSGMFMRLARRVRHPLRVTRGRRPGRSPRPRQAAAWFQDEPGGEWHRARVRDTGHTTR